MKMLEMEIMLPSTTYSNTIFYRTTAKFRLCSRELFFAHIPGSDMSRAYSKCCKLALELNVTGFAHLEVMVGLTPQITYDLCFMWIQVITLGCLESSPRTCMTNRPQAVHTNAVHQKNMENWLWLDVA